MKCARPDCSLEQHGKSKYCREHAKVARELWKKMITEQSDARAERDEQFAELWQKAHSAGMAAGSAHAPTPMVVYTPKDVMASFGNDNKPEFVDGGDGTLLVSSGNIDINQPVYTVNDGVCGFAWVNIRPGNHPFVNWMKKHGKLGQNPHPSYYGGYDVWVSEFGQSMERKEQYARAFSAVLREAGIKAHSMSRMD